MTRDGEVCEHQRWVRPTVESGGSASVGWPTPCASDPPPLQRVQRESDSRWTSEGSYNSSGANRGLTPTAQAAKHGAPTEWEKQSGRNGLWIAAAQAWPTPSAQIFDQSPEVFDARRERLKRRGVNGNGAGRLLAVEVRRSWPTPSATDHKGSSKPGQRQGQLTEPLEPGSGGRLNPSWVEALQGFPLRLDSPHRWPAPPGPDAHLGAS